MRKGRFCGGVIGVLFVLSFLLRVQNWFHFKVPDETAIAAWVGDLFSNPFPVNSYPPLFLYLLYALVRLMAWIAEWLGIVLHAAQLVAQPDGWRVIEKTGQILSALIGSLQVLVAWRIGREFFSRSAGLIAALLIAVNPLLILDSHINKSDILLSFLAGLVLFFTLRFDRSEQIRDLFWASFFVGLAAAAKYQGILLAGSSLLLLFKYPVGKEFLRLFKSGLLILSGIVLGFLAGSPNCLVHPWEQLKEVYRIIFYHYVEFNMHGYDATRVSFHRYFIDFCRSFGLWVMLAAAIFLLFWWKSHRREKVILFTPVLIYIGLLGSRPIYAHRFGLPLYTHLALLSALALTVFFFELFEKWKFLPSRRRWAAALLAALGLFYLARMTDYSWRRFELLSTSGTFDRALLFRRNHFSPQTHFIRETLTPIFPGDVGVWDISAVPLWRFRGPRSMSFVTTGLISSYILTEADKPAFRSAVLDRLNGFLPFHKIEKPRFGPWDGDIWFWYRTGLAKIRRPIGKKLSRCRFFTPRQTTRGPSIIRWVRTNRTRAG